MIIPAKELVDKAVIQLSKFQSGEESVAKTSIDHFNDMTMGGVRKGNIIVIGARPGVGKSYMAQIIEGDFLNTTLNPQSENYIVIKCNWEMAVMKLVTRSLARGLNRSYRDILLKTPRKEDIPKFKEICDKERDSRNFYIELPLTAQQMEEELDAFLSGHQDKEMILVSVDHIGLVRDSGKGKKGAIDDLIEACNRLRNKYPNVAFLILCQLNREIESRSDVKNQAPVKGDLMNSDTVVQIADTVIAINNPSSMHIDRYMLVPGIVKDPYGNIKESKYSHLAEFMHSPNNKMTNFMTEVDGRPLLFYHYVKVRDGIDEVVHYRDLYIQKI